MVKILYTFSCLVFSCVSFSYHLLKLFSARGKFEEDFRAYSSTFCYSFDLFCVTFDLVPVATNESYLYMLPT